MAPSNLAGLYETKSHLAHCTFSNLSIVKIDVMFGIYKMRNKIPGTDDYIA